MRKENIYSSKNVFLLVSVFLIVFWLLYSLANYWHESSKIRAEIDAIHQTNERNLLEIEEKKAYLEYLESPQRIDKEAKILMRKKQPDEKVLVVIEEKIDILPPDSIPEMGLEFVSSSLSIPEKWKWVFLHK